MAGIDYESMSAENLTAIEARAEKRAVRKRKELERKARKKSRADDKAQRVALAFQTAREATEGADSDHLRKAIGRLFMSLKRN